jgi:hypothetical protein
MKLRLLSVGMLLAASAFAATQPTPSPWKPKTPPPAAQKAPAKPRVTHFVNGIPDTGQFLPDSVWLLQVGPRVRTVGDFIREYNATSPEGKPGDDSLGHVTFMNTLIHSDLLALAALDRNAPLDFADRAVLRETEVRALSDVLFLRAVLDRAHVSDAEVAEAIRQRNQEAHLRRIVFADRAVAEDARSQIAAGRLKWNDAVARWSLVRPTKDNPGGDAGWVPRSTFVGQEGAVLFRLKPGELSPVLRSAAGGWEISQMVALRDRPPLADDNMVDVTRSTLRSARAGVIADSMQAMVARRVNLEYDSTNVAWAASRFSRSMTVERVGYSPTVHIDGSTPDFSPADTSRVLARWKDGGYFTLGMFMHWYTGLNPMLRPDVTFPSALESNVGLIVLEPFRAEVARERGLDKDPEFLRRYQNRREELLVEHLYQDSVAASVWVTKEERRAYYDAHPAEFTVGASADFAMILRHTKAGVDSLKAALDAGAKPWDVIAADSARGEQTGGMQHRTDAEKGRFHKVLFEELRPGQSAIFGPDKDGDYGVLYLASYTPERLMPYSEAEGLADESMQNIKAEARLNAFLDRLRARYPVRWRPELAARINTFRN